MPFKSQKQQRYLYANEPELAAKWQKESGNPPKKDKSPWLGMKTKGGK